MSEHVFWILELAIRPGQFDNFKALLGEMVEATEATEPNALHYEWFVSRDEKTCHLYERYADSQAVMVHLNNFGKKFAGRFMAALEPTRLTVYGDPSKEVIGALSALGGVFLKAAGGFAR